MEATTQTPAHAISCACDHCGLPLPQDRAGRSRFCCAGCEAVYGLLRSRDLEEYYDLKSSHVSVRPAGPAPVVDESFAYLDDAETAAQHAAATEDGKADGSRCIQFYLEGVHCVACVWLTEKLPEFVPGVRSARLDLGNSVASVTLGPGVSAARVAREFARLGYRPHPVKLSELDELQSRESRTLLIRMAVAGFCAGNIMLLAVALYAGADQGLRELFRWASFALSLPVVLYSAIPFYQGALKALRLREASIDLPIAIGTIVATIASSANLVRGSDHVYFDSTTMLVFLLLSVRYVLRRAQQSAAISSRLIHFLIPSTARVLSADGAYHELPLARVRAGDRIEVRPGEPIPIDGVIVEGSSRLNGALLTGEAAPERKETGDSVYAGTLNLTSRLVIQVRSAGEATRLGGILASVEEGLRSQAPVSQLADRVSKGFVWAIVLVSLLILGLGFMGDWEEALSRSLALAIVACPCAFALATPLAVSTTLGRAARAGILIRNGEIIERLASAREIFLDKTGTLTTGRFEVLGWQIDQDAPEALDVAVALERYSNHPIAKAIVERFGPGEGAGAVRVGDWVETIGQGVAGTVGPNRYEIRGDGSERGSVILSRDARPIARFRLGDALRPDSRDAVRDLRALGLRCWILSGDARPAVQAAARDVGIDPDHAIHGASPEAKRGVVARHEHAIMVGDGANDAIALSAASVGIAVHSGLEVSMRAAGIYQSTPGVLPVVRLVEASRETMKVIRRALGFSLVYNVVGVAAALAGWVNPLFAAVLMPLSSLTVLAIAGYGTRKLRRAFA